MLRALPFTPAEGGPDVRVLVSAVLVGAALLGHGALAEPPPADPRVVVSDALQHDTSAPLREGVKYANVAGLPLLVALFGIVRLVRRRRRTREPYRPLVPVEGSAG